MQPLCCGHSTNVDLPCVRYPGFSSSIQGNSYFHPYGGMIALRIPTASQANDQLLFLPSTAPAPQGAMINLKHSKFIVKAAIDSKSDDLVGLYHRSHSILTVGDGDLSFSVAVARGLGSGANIVATTNDSESALFSKYKNARTNKQCLEELGAQVICEVDCTTMSYSPPLLSDRGFDRIIYNFPHSEIVASETSALTIQSHQKLLRGFFKNAAVMLNQGGEVHVTHKTNHPYCLWHLPDLASQRRLLLVKRAEFRRMDYPGYRIKRGCGPDPDVPFYVGKCTTFVFRSAEGVGGDD